ncbi:hypothetical protein SESBI_01818 [Sesbania bispinosa]|nr:hypothetical protein SESBI_01818 [Sesbania bispinosa]
MATMNSPIKLQSMSLIKMEAELGVGGFSNSEVAGNPKYWELLSPLLPDRTKLWIVGNDDFIVKMLVRARFKILYQMITWRMNLDVHCSITYMCSPIAHDIWNVTGLGLCDVYSEQ